MSYLDSAARTLERILTARHPERVWIVSVREDARRRRDVEVGADDTDTILKTHAGAPSPGAPDDHPAEKAA